MAENLLLGLFQEATPTANAIEQLRELGVVDEKVTVMSSIPYEPTMLARPRPRGGLGPIVIFGAILGLMTALFLTVGIFLLYPLVQGRQPTIPVPPSLIIVFEVMMLGTMWSAFFGFLAINRFPVFGQPAYDVRITTGDIGVLAEVNEELLSRAESVFKENGAHDVRRLENRQQINTAAWIRFVTAGGLATAVVIIIAVLFWYDVLRIPFLSQMVNQQSIGYEQGPRLAAPSVAIPVQGPVLIAGQPATGPLPPTANSLQRGQVLFSINCALCHGQGGAGNGPLSAFFTPKPSDLTSSGMQSLSDDEIFLVITQGFFPMPSIAENLSSQDRWDVINYIRTLKK